MSPGIHSVALGCTCEKWEKLRIAWGRNSDPAYFLILAHLASHCMKSDSHFFKLKCRTQCPTNPQPPISSLENVGGGFFRSRLTIWLALLKMYTAAFTHERDPNKFQQLEKAIHYYPAEYQDIRLGNTIPQPNCFTLCLWPSVTAMQ